MRTFAALAATLLLAGFAAADDKKGTVVEMAGMKSTTPADWKEADKLKMMRIHQYVAPKVEGDAQDAEVSVFFFKKGEGGSVKDNLKRQTAKFLPAAGKDKVEESIDEKFKVGNLTAALQDIKGTYKDRPAPMVEKFTERPNWRMLYVAFDSPDGLYTLWLLGPEKTVEKHKKGFEEWLKNFK